MSGNTKVALAGLWLMAGSACIVLPVFVPSYIVSGDPIANVVGTSAVTMFILSFPASLLGLPVSMLLQSALEVGPYSLMGLYVNTLVFFALGIGQWFWAMQRLQVYLADARAAENASDPGHSVGKIARGVEACAFDEDELSPVERVFDEKK